MLDVTPNEVVGKTFVELTHGDDRQRTQREFERLLTDISREGSWDATLIRKDGRPLRTHINATVLRDAEGKPFRTVAVILDITGRD
jgi:two-component system CheB/CheR fusion protein